jgi:hypothetical protein
MLAFPELLSKHYSVTQSTFSIPQRLVPRVSDSSKGLSMVSGQCYKGSLRAGLSLSFSLLYPNI